MFGYGAVSCAQVYAVSSRWNKEQPRQLVPKSQGIKSTDKSEAASNSPVYSLRRVTNSCNRSRASQTDGYNTFCHKRQPDHARNISESQERSAVGAALRA